MNPYHNALKKKKFEGLSIHIQPHGQAPIDPDEMRKSAANGDQAPEVMDKAEPDPQQDLLHQDALDAGHVQSENEMDDTPDKEPISKEPPHPGTNIGHTEHRKTSLREKMNSAMKKKGY